MAADLNGKSINGATHIGSYQGWNDYFIINLNQLENDDLDLTAYIDGSHFGMAKFNYMQLARLKS